MFIFPSFAREAIPSLHGAVAFLISFWPFCNLSWSTDRVEHVFAACTDGSVTRPGCSPMAGTQRN